MDLGFYAQFQVLHDGTGRHLGGLYPPLVVDNELTEFYRNNVAERPLHRRLQLDGGDANDVGAVWMMPLGGPVDPVTMSQVLPVLVQALDAGQSVMLHADRQETLDHAGIWAGLCVGGGNA